MTDSLNQAKINLIHAFKVTAFVVRDGYDEAIIREDVYDARPIVTIDLDQDDEPRVTFATTCELTLDQLEAVYVYARAISPIRRSAMDAVIEASRERYFASLGTIG